MITSCEKADKKLDLKFVSDPATNRNLSSIYTLDYSDECFSADSLEFSPEIAKLSMILSAAAFSHEAILDDLNMLGFEKNAKFNYGSTADENAVGLVMATKKVGDTNIVCVVLRGTLEKEWYSNFEIGKNSDITMVHKGFDNAARFALDKLEMYLVNYSIDRDHTRFFVTGHSRGGAVANLMSAKLIDKYGSDNVYAYTFASPNPTKSKSATDLKYKGIFNFVNPNDFICYVPLEKWGFSKFGTTIFFADEKSDNYDIILSDVKRDFLKYTGREYKSFDSTEKLDGFLDKVYELSPTVDEYYNKKYDILGSKMSVYDYMMTVAEIMNNENMLANGLMMLGCDGTEFEELTDFLTSGMSFNSDELSMDYEDSLIAYAHTCETYIAFLDAYIKSM